MRVAGRSYGEAYGTFRWEIPDRFNTAEAICDRHLGDGRTALLFEAEDGRTAELTFEHLAERSRRLANALAARGVKRLAVVTPGFSADCLETIEEIGGENAEYFHEGGGERFARIECLNDSPGGLRVIEAIVRRELMGWI